LVRFIDSNVFIYHIDRNPVFGGTSREILQRVERGEETVTSTLVLEEVFIHVEQEYSPQDIPSVLYSILSYVPLRIIPYTVEDMLRATEILGEAGFTVDWDDAIIAAVMERLGIKEIYSNDHHFDKIPSVKRIFE
jgi:predicted nucleic acid-binding protein